MWSKKWTFVKPSAQASSCIIRWQHPNGCGKMETFFQQKRLSYILKFKRLTFKSKNILNDSILRTKINFPQEMFSLRDKKWLDSIQLSKGTLNEKTICSAVWQWLQHSGRAHALWQRGHGFEPRLLFVCGHRPKTKELLELLLFLLSSTIWFISSLKEI